MKKFFLQSKRCITALVLISAICVGTLSPYPFGAKKTEAGLPVTDGINWIQNTISAGADALQAGLMTTLHIKELTLDGIAFGIINLVLQEMSRSIVTWINSGFQGSPAFVTDLEGYMTDIADKVAGEVIWNSEDLQFLCSPFALDIQIVLDIQYREGRDFIYHCTASDVIENVDSFLSGNFIEGGWAGFFEISMNPNNNPYGVLLMKHEEIALKSQQTKGNAKKEIEIGRGFLAQKDCQRVENREVCRTVTPGSVIEEQLNNSLGSGQRRIEVADEINEIVAALFGQLAKQALGGIGGLLGLTSSAGGSSGNYYDQLAQQSTGSLTNGSGNPIEDSRDTEVSYQNMKLDIIDMIEELETYKDDTYGAGDSCHSGDLSDALQNRKDAALQETTVSESTIMLLNNLLVQYEIASSTPGGANEMSKIMQQYLELQSEGVLHTEADLYIVETIDFYDLNEESNLFKDEIDTACIRLGGA